MPFTAAETGREKAFNQILGQGEAGDPTSQAHEVQVIMLHPLVGGIDLSDQSGAHPGDFIGGDRGAHTTATQGQTPIYLSLRHRPGQRGHDIGIIVFVVELVGTEINNLYPHRRNSGMSFSFNSKPP